MICGKAFCNYAHPYLGREDTSLVWNLFNLPQMKKLHPLGYSKLLELVCDIPSEAVSKSLLSQRKTKIAFAIAKQCVTREKSSPGPCGETAGALAGKRVWQQSPKAACFCKTWQSVQFCRARIGCPVPLYCFLVTASFLLLSRSLCKHSNRAKELKRLMLFFLTKNPPMCARWPRDTRVHVQRLDIWQSSSKSSHRMVTTGSSEKLENTDLCCTNKPVQL